MSQTRVLPVLSVEGPRPCALPGQRDQRWCSPTQQALAGSAAYAPHLSSSRTVSRTSAAALRLGTKSTSSTSPRVPRACAMATLRSKLAGYGPGWHTRWHEGWQLEARAPHLCADYRVQIHHIARSRVGGHRFHHPQHLMHQRLLRHAFVDGRRTCIQDGGGGRCREREGEAGRASCGDYAPFHPRAKRSRLPSRSTDSCTTATTSLDRCVK